MSSPSGSIAGTIYPIEDSSGNTYSINSNGQLVFTLAPQIFNASSGTLDLVLYYNGNIYALQKNGTWYQWAVPSYSVSSGGGWTVTGGGTGADPRP